MNEKVAFKFKFKYVNNVTFILKQNFYFKRLVIITYNKDYKKI